jgi:membrane protein
VKRIAAALLDIDGTLVDSNGFHVLAWRRAFADARFDISQESIRRQIGKGADMLIPSLLPQANDETRRRIADRHGEIFKSRYLPRVQPFPRAADLVRRLRAAGVRVVLASSSSGEEVDHYVGLLGVADALTATTSSDDVEHTKPAGDVFAAALVKVAPVEAADCIVVGDTPYDVIAARKCGMQTIALLSGGFEESWLRREGAVAVYGDTAELLEGFETWGQR